MSQKVEPLCIWTKVDLPVMGPVHTAIATAASAAMVFMIGMPRDVSMLLVMVGFVLVSVGLFEGSINSDVFYAWLTQALVPVLPVNAVVVMDNARFHKRADMLEAIEQSGALLEFLPPYSPDLNPIEKKWAQAKAIRKRERCDVDTLFSVHMNYDKL